MSAFCTLEDFTFRVHGRLVDTLKGTVIRSTKDGRVMLVRANLREGGQVVTRSKERPTENRLSDVAKLIHPAD